MSCISVGEISIAARGVKCYNNIHNANDFICHVLTLQALINIFDSQGVHGIYTKVKEIKAAD